MDTAASSAHKDMYKIARVGLADRVMAVRTAASKCLIKMSASASFLHKTELESLTSTCLRALDGADYDARVAVSDLLGCIIAATQLPPSNRTRPSTGTKNKCTVCSSSSAMVLFVYPLVKSS